MKLLIQSKIKGGDNLQWNKKSALKKGKEAFSKIEGKITQRSYQSFRKGKEYPSFTIIQKYFNTWNNFKKQVSKNVEIYASRNDEWDRKTIIKALQKAHNKLDKMLVEKYYELTVNLAEYPSVYKINDEFGSWNNMKEELFADEEIYNRSRKDKKLTKENYCDWCGIGRCRFDYNLEKCEYYEGE